MKDLRFTEEPQVTGGMFLKIADGETVAGVLRGEVKAQYVVWDDNKKSHPCEPNAKGAKFRFKVNFVVMDKDGNMTPKILEQGPSFYKDLKALAEDYNLEETLLKIKRSGSDKNTTYTIMPTPKPPSAETLKKLASLELHSLEDQTEGTPAPDISDVPF
jgi:hypothetical protein